jgi:hypothetical protein
MKKTLPQFRAKTQWLAMLGEDKLRQLALRSMEGNKNLKAAYPLLSFPTSSHHTVDFVW